MEPILKAELHITSRGWLLMLVNEQHKVPRHEKLHIHISAVMHLTCDWWLWLSPNVINFTDPPSGSADVECQLLEAAKAGDSEQVQRLLTSYPQIVNCRDLDGR